MVFLAGALSILAQVILLRELAAAFYGIDLIYVLALGAWLLWTALGALLCRRTRNPTSTRVAILLVALGLVVPLDVLLVRRLRLLLGGVAGAFLPLSTQLVSSVLCLMPTSVLLGLLFQWTAKRYLSQAAHATTSRAYAIESAGAVAGGLVTTWAVWAGVQNLTLALATGAVALAAASLASSAKLKPCPTDVLPGLPRPTRPSLQLIARALLALCAIAVWQSPSIDLATTRWNHPDVVETADTAYGRITVTKRAGQVSVYENDALSFESEGTDAEEFVHISLVQHPSPKRVLLVGGAAADLIRFALEHRVEAIDDVELNARLVRAMERWLPARYTEAVRNPGVRVTFDDPRRAIANCARLSCSYDVIIVAAAEPSSAQANRFFTREFFSNCAARLRPGGVVALRLPSVENAWTPQMLARTASIHAALRAVFNDVVVLPGANNVVLASNTVLLRDAAVLGARLEERQIEARLVTPRYVRYLYSNDRNGEIQAMLRAANAQPNTDANPASYQATALVWLSKFVPSAAQVDLAWLSGVLGWRSWISWILIVGFAAFAASMRKNRRRPLAVVAAAAFAGMVIESLLLVHYQLKHGVVFQDLGVLLTAVMVGLGMGAMMAGRLKLQRARMTLLLLALAVLALVTSLCIRTGVGSGLPPVSLLLAGTGACVGAVFGIAAGDVADQQSAVSPVYAADVIGGSLGSLVASFVFVPLLGLPLAAEWTAAVAACAAIATWNR